MDLNVLPVYSFCILEVLWKYSASLLKVKLRYFKNRAIQIFSLPLLLSNI